MPKNPDTPKEAPFDLNRYDAHRSAVAVIMAHFFLRYLNLLHREFEGDLLLPIVLGEIAHHNIFRFYSQKGNTVEVREAVGTDLDRMQQLEPTNAFSLSQATGIPRETVRRKIDKLKKKGWVVQNERGEVFMSETVSDHFTKDFNKKILSELLETADCIRKLVNSDPNNPENQR